MLLIYIPQTTPRHQYVFNHIMGYLGIDFSITNNRDLFTTSENSKFSYADAPLHDELHFYADGLLGEDTVSTFTPQTGAYKEIITLFPHQISGSALPFDVFSAVFYMLSRYEEYLPFTSDEHGRFEAINSLAHKHNFLHLPLVDLWIKQLAEVLQLRFPSLQFKKHSYTFIPTYDIDIAYSYKHKGFKRNLGGYFRDGLHFNIAACFRRVHVLLNIAHDPFDSYDYQFGLQEKYQLNPIYFFHPGTYGPFDKNISPENKHIRHLLDRIAERSPIGIHPSYISVEKPELLATEIKRLEQACGKKITSARQHFIKIRFPETYRNYLANGITDDYSMGFATDIGFRAGTSQPFLFFDLQKNRVENLTIHPFVFMEGVFKQHKQLPADDILRQIAPIIEQIKQLDGTFISLWHNESLGTSKTWKGWRSMYENMIELAQNK